jgi:hypothetical protein
MPKMPPRKTRLCKTSRVSLFKTRKSVENILSEQDTDNCKVDSGKLTHKPTD